MRPFTPQAASGPRRTDNALSFRQGRIRMDALRGLALLLVLQAAGDGLAHGLRLPVPGPVVGMLLLILALRLERLRAPVRAIAELLLAHLSLLFVPVGVGVITHLDLLAHSGVVLLVAIVVSTWAGMAVSALVLKRLLGADQRELDSAEDARHD
jgi:holin-like protein